ncbi:MAG: MFS transporter [Chloroflexi bacterium]|nr:MFS transporter [Chloroflexota bacterium]
MAGVAGQAAVGSWFVARRPRALGTVGMIGALGGSAMAVLAQFMLDQIGWRGVMMIYGGLTLLLVVGPSALLLRRSPEDVGLRPDGFTLEQAAAAAKARGNRTGRTGEEYNWTLRQAIRTPALWLITASGSVALFGITGVSVHQIAYFTDRGIPTSAAAAVLTVYTFSSAISSFIWGFLTERFDERIMSVGALATSAACVWFLTTIDTVAGALVFAGLFGACARGQNTLVGIVFSQYYGRGSFGAISGFATPFQTFAAAIGPIVAAMAFDATGSYIGVFTLLIGVFALASFLMFLARRPTPPTQPSASL